MFKGFKNCDFLSPQITLYFKGAKIHNSTFSGIFTIITFLLIFIYSIFNIKGYINKENPTIYYYNRYVEDAGSFPLNSSSMFHYFQLISNGRQQNITIDYDSIRIIGISRSIDYYMRMYDLSQMEHWVYGTCNYNEINNDEISELISEETFSQSACIKEYYNFTSKKYSKIGESGFKWPILSHGASNPNRTLYGIIIEKCHNDSLKKFCRSEKEINEYFSQFAMSLNIIDEYADVLNYKNPFTKYIYALTSDQHIGSISLNHLNFNPTITKTHFGFLLDRIVNIYSYAFTQNEKKTIESGKTNIVAAFYFWMQNIMVYNERSYRKFEDLLSNIGGFGSFVFLIAVFINYLVNNYVIILDTEELILNIGKVIYDRSSNKLIVKPIISKKENKIYKISNPPKLKNNKNQYNQNQNSKLPIFINERCDNNTNIIGTPRSTRLNIEFLQYKRTENNNINRYLNINNNENKRKDYMNLPKHTVEAPKGTQSQKLESFSENLIDFQKINGKFTIYNSKNKENKIIKDNSGEIKKTNITWFNYLCYLICLKKNNQKIKFFEDFRARIINEENLFQNYFDIYKLLKVCNIKNHNDYELNILKKMINSKGF